jgi:hypothetical protein
MEWLRQEVIMDAPLAEMPGNEFRWCLDRLSESGAIAVSFNETFRPTFGEIKTHLTQRAEEEPRLKFSCNIAKDDEQLRVLVHKERLYVALLNWTVDVYKDYEGEDKQCEVIIQRSREGDRNRILFRVLTDYAPADQAEQNVRYGNWREVTDGLLRPFGVERCKWDVPVAEEQARGFTAALNVFVPHGFVRKGSQ